MEEKVRILNRLSGSIVALAVSVSLAVDLMKVSFSIAVKQSWTEGASLFRLIFQKRRGMENGRSNPLAIYHWPCCR